MWALILARVGLEPVRTLTFREGQRWWLIWFRCRGMKMETNAKPFSGWKNTQKFLMFLSQKFSALGEGGGTSLSLSLTFSLSLSQSHSSLLLQCDNFSSEKVSSTWKERWQILKLEPVQSKNRFCRKVRLLCRKWWHKCSNESNLKLLVDFLFICISIHQYL